MYIKFQSHKHAFPKDEGWLGFSSLLESSDPCGQGLSKSNSKKLGPKIPFGIVPNASNEFMPCCLETWHLKAFPTSTICIASCDLLGICSNAGKHPHLHGVMCCPATKGSQLLTGPLEYSVCKDKAALVCHSCGSEAHGTNPNASSCHFRQCRVPFLEDGMVQSSTPAMDALATDLSQLQGLLGEHTSFGGRRA